MEYKTLWRYDEYMLTVDCSSVSIEAPVGKWLPARLGSGGYIYFESHAEAVECAKEDILNKIEDLKSKLDEIILVN